MNTDELRAGCIQSPKRWSGDCGEHSRVDESATDKLMIQAADEIDRLREIAHRARVQFCREGSDGAIAATMFAILCEAERSKQ